MCPRIGDVSLSKSTLGGFDTESLLPYRINFYRINSYPQVVVHTHAQTKDFRFPNAK